VLLRIARTFFWIAIAATIAGAFAPPSMAVELLPWDKAGHFLAFYGLTVLAVIAFPVRRLDVIAIALSVFGGLIEIVQSLPFVHRDGDWRDWITDCAAIVAVLIPIGLVRLRNDFRR
jgi:VanZ family protein